MLQFLPGGQEGDVLDLFEVPLQRASTGHFLSVYCTPLYFAGYYAVMRIFSSTSYFLSRSLLVLGIYAFAISGMWLSSQYFAAYVFQNVGHLMNQEDLINTYLQHYEYLTFSVRISILLVSIIFVILILNNRLGFPKWMVLINPALLLGFIFLMKYWVPTLSHHLHATAMNIAHILFFGIVLYEYQRLRKPFT